MVIALQGYPLSTYESIVLTSSAIRVVFVYSCHMTSVLPTVLSTDCVECMACSDNVVRAGLTPKFKDKKTLCSMLDYTMSPAQSRIFPWCSEEGDPRYHIYNPPVPEFSVISSSFPQGQHSLKPRNGPSILLVTQGKGSLRVDGSQESLSIVRGSVLFLGHTVSSSLSVDEPLSVYQALCDASSQ